MKNRITDVEPTSGAPTGSNAMLAEVPGEWKDEYILCAAIHYNDFKQYLHQPKNIETGMVICGRRHHNIIYNWNQLSLGKTRRTDTQGFLTNKDRFVNREEAAKIAFESGQISMPKKELFSEDVW